MNLSAYSESQGKLTNEVVIRFDARDKDDPWLTRRRAEYQKRGMKVLLRAHEPRGGRRQHVATFSGNAK